ncbi:MAG TPA: hypothetical protein VGV90_11650 [Solirubrobacteraceae bacterium]|nr:hypothetical protein [Solirubrobacteraceae bacterium]
MPACARRRSTTGSAGAAPASPRCATPVDRIDAYLAAWHPARARGGHAPDSERELHTIVRASSAGDEIEHEEGRLAARALAFDELRVREIMRPRHEVVVIDAGACREEALAQANATGFTRFPLVDGGGLFWAPPADAPGRV